MNVPKVGDIIKFCAFAYKLAAELSGMFPGVDFSPRVRQAWCEQRRYTRIQSTALLREFVEEINRSIDNPCE